MPHSPSGEDGGAGNDNPPRGEAYVEFKQVGQTMKVTAVDAVSGLEVVIMGPASASRNDLQRIAIRKLKAQLDKKKNDPPPDPEEDDDSGSKGWMA